MQFNSLTQLGRRAPTIWLQVTLSGRLDADAVAAWNSRLRAFLRKRRLLGAIAPRRLAVLSPGACPTPFERGVLIGWLVAQPEVVFVRVQRRVEPAQVEQELAHG
jgi:hypothetical protein